MSDVGEVSIDEEVRLVGDAEEREDRPLDFRVLGGAGHDVSIEQGPGHGLRDTSLEVDGHRMSARELAEDQLLTRLGRDGLQEELS